MPKQVETVTTTFRLEKELRSVLEAIAAREERSLSGQVILFLKQSVRAYMSENGLDYYPDMQEVATEEEYAEYMMELMNSVSPEDADR